MQSKRYRSKKKISSKNINKKYRSKKKLYIKTTSIASFGKQFGDEFGKVLSSGFRTTRNPVVKFNKRKKNW